MCIAILEERRRIARNSIVDGIANLAVGSCPVRNCGAGLRDIAFPRNCSYALGAGGVWPPDWTATSVRKMLNSLHLMPDTPLGGRFMCNHGGTRSISKVYFRLLAGDISLATMGICINCMKGAKAQCVCKNESPVRIEDTSIGH